MTTHEEYNEAKEVFGRLNKTAKELKLLGITEQFDSQSDEQEVYGYIPHPKAKEGWGFEVTIKETWTPEEDQHSHEATGGTND